MKSQQHNKYIAHFIDVSSNTLNILNNYTVTQHKELVQKLTQKMQLNETILIPDICVKIYANSITTHYDTLLMSCKLCHYDKSNNNEYVLHTYSEFKQLYYDNEDKILSKLYEYLQHLIKGIINVPIYAAKVVV